MAYQFASFARPASPGTIESDLIDPFLTRLLSIGALTDDQIRIVTAMQGPPFALRPRSQLGRTGDPAGTAYVIREGWAFAYTLLANGERQVHGFLLPGNVVRFDDLFHTGAGRGVEMITDAVVSELSMDSLHRASREWPEIFELFLRLQSQVHAALVEQLIDLGRRDSRARLAHLLLMLEHRLAHLGLAGPDGYDCPLSQYLIADALGLTAIHVNRVLRGLREQGIVTLRKERVTIHDHARLMAIAGYSEGDAVAEPAGLVRRHRRPSSSRRSRLPA